MNNATFICSNQFERQLIIQCSCAGLCSYINIFDIGMNYFSGDDERWGKRYCFNLLSIFPKKYKKVENFCNDFLMTHDDLFTLYTAFRDANKTSVGFVSDGKYTIIVRKDFDDIYQIFFYENKHKKMSNKPFFDVCITPEMCDEICNTLGEWLGNR